MSAARSLSWPATAFEHHYEQIAQPFAWTFTRRDLDALIAKLEVREAAARRPAA